MPKSCLLVSSNYQPQIYFASRAEHLGVLEFAHGGALMVLMEIKINTFFHAMIGENRQLVTDEAVESEK